MLEPFLQFTERLQYLEDVIIEGVGEGELDTLYLLHYVTEGGGYLNYLILGYLLSLLLDYITIQYLLDLILPFRLSLIPNMPIDIEAL